MRRRWAAGECDGDRHGGWSKELAALAGLVEWRGGRRGRTSGGRQTGQVLGRSEREMEESGREREREEQ
jgi:hypothetical protein